MSESEKRGPIEKTEKGWPVNPIGVVALIVFGAVIVFLIARPLFQQKTRIIDQNQQANNKGGTITSPKAGDIVKGASSLPITLTVDDKDNVAKVQFWAKTYADGNWQMIGEVTSAPYTLNWQIPASSQNKAIAITAHIYTKDNQIIKDPGGWREGIIILSQ